MKIEIYAGTHILMACMQAVEAAKEHGETVTFAFNDIAMEATAESDPHNLMHDWNVRSQKMAEEYRRSPAGIKAAQEAEQRRRDSQDTVNRLLGELPAALHRLSTLVEWLAEFCVAADHFQVTYDKSVIIVALKAAGYEASYGVGDPPESFNTKDRMGRYIVGQALSSMIDHDMPPHPITAAFAEKFRRLPA